MIIPDTDLKFLQSALYSDSKRQILRTYERPGSGCFIPAGAIRVSSNADITDAQIKYISEQPDTQFRVQLISLREKEVDACREFLSLPNVSGLDVFTLETVPESLLGKLESLTYLAIDASRNVDVLDQCISLKAATFNFSEGVPSLGDWSALEYVECYFNPRRKLGCEKFGDSNELKTLIFHHAPLKNLDFLDRFLNIRCLHLDPMGALENVGGLENLSRLYDLRVDRARKVGNWMVLDSLAKINKLSLLGCGDIVVPTKFSKEGNFDLINFYGSRPTFS